MKNKDVLNWYNGLEDKSGFNIVSQFKLLVGVPTFHSDKAVLMKIKRLAKKVKKLTKNKNAELKTFLEEIFVLPSDAIASAAAACETDRERTLQAKVITLKADCKNLKRKVTSFDDLKGSFETKVIEMKALSSNLEECLKDKKLISSELTSIKETYEQKSEELHQLEEKFTALKSRSDDKTVRLRNEHKKLQRRDSTITKDKEKMKEKEKEFKMTVNSLNKKIKNLESLVSDIRFKEASICGEKESLRKKLIYMRKKLGDKQELIDEFSGKDFLEMSKECDDLAKKVKNLNSENRDLQELVSLLEDDEIVTFHDGKYCNEIREVVMRLLSLNVSMRNIDDVIRCVLKKLVNKDICRLPSIAVKSRIQEEALILAQIQVGEAMLNETSTTNCLHGDGTSKYHKHYQNFQITTSEGKTLSFGLSEVAGGDAGMIFNNFTETVEDLCKVLGTPNSDTDDLFSKLISNIRSTMSDQGPVNPLFNEKLKVLRKELLPNAIKNWNELSADDQSLLGEMGNFFCKLHLLANFATEGDKVLNVFEKLVLSDDYETVFAFNTKESGAARLVRTACKAFHVRGSDEAGVASYFNSFLAGQDQTSQFASFIGNRFNILFYNAAALYYHRHSVLKFVKSWPNPNNLLKAVAEDLSNKVFCAEVRALGIIDKLLTGPLWRLIEAKNSILELNSYIFHLKLRLSDLCKDSSSLLHGQKVFTLPDVVVHDNDEVYQSLFEEVDGEFDTLTQQALEVVFHAILIILERQCADQLPGGRYWNPDENITMIASNVPTTNRASESDFAVLDLLVRTKPNARVQTIQALTMWCRNDTSQWIESKTEEERNEIFDKARRMAPEMRLLYEERKKNLIDTKERRLKAKQEQKRESEEKSAAKKAECVNNLIKAGEKVWLSESEADEKIKNIEVRNRPQVIELQLAFYKNVLGVKCQNSLYYKTKMENGKRVRLEWEESLANLKKVIKISLVKPSEKVSLSVLKNEKEREEIVKQHKRKLAESLKESRLKKVIQQQKSSLLSDFLQEPLQVVGRKIQHKVKEEDDDVIFWSLGEVMAISKQHANPKRILFTIKYEDDENMFDMPILSDFEKGDVIFI